MQVIEREDATSREKQHLDEASIEQLNKLQLSPHQGTKGPHVLDNFLELDAIPKGHCIPKTNLTPPLEPPPAVTTSDTPSLTYASTLPTQEFEIAPLQRNDSNEATWDTNSQHSAESATSSPSESLIPSEARFNSHVVTGVAQHLDGHYTALDEDQQRTSNIDLSMTQEEVASPVLNDEVTAVLDHDLTSTFALAHEDDNATRSAISTPSVYDRPFLPPPQRKPSRLASALSRPPQKVSSGVDEASTPLVQGGTCTSMTDAVQDIDNYRDESGSNDLSQGMAMRNARQERILLIGLFMQLMFYGVLLTFLMLQTLHPALFEV